MNGDIENRAGEDQRKALPAPRKRHGLSRILFPQTKGRLLALFYNNLDRRYYLRDIAKEVGISIGAVNPVLTELVYAGIVNMAVEGKKKFYSVNRDCPVYEELKSLVQKTVGLVDPIRDALDTHRKNMTIAFIFGSVATGEDTGRSDIDLMVIGQLTLKELSAAIYPLEEQLKRPINPHLYTADSFLKAFKEENHFIRYVLKTKLLFLFGSHDDVRRMVGEQ